MIEKPLSGVGTRLARFRKLAGISAQELSDLVGGEMSRAVIANIESGRKVDLTVDQVVSLAWALGVPFAALAFPIDKPFEFVAVIRGTGPGSWYSMRSADMLGWANTMPEPFKRERSKGLNAAGLTARAMLRAIGELGVLQGDVAALKVKVAQDPEYQDVLDERVEELDALEDEMRAMGFDLSTPDDPEPSSSEEVAHDG